jgi:hypothetical protein
MENNNFLQVIEPDYNIKIGLKDGKVCKLDWGEVVDKEELHNVEVITRVKEILQEAVKMLK